MQLRSGRIVTSAPIIDSVPTPTNVNVRNDTKRVQWLQNAYKSATDIQKRNILRIMIEDIIFTPPTNDFGKPVLRFPLWHDLVLRVMLNKTIQVQLDKWVDKHPHATSIYSTQYKWLQRAVWIVKYWATHSSTELRQFVDRRKWLFIAMSAIYLACPTNTCPHCTLKAHYCSHVNRDGDSLFSKDDYLIYRSTENTGVLQYDIDKFEELVAEHADMRYIMYTINKHNKYAPMVILSEDANA